MLYLLSRELWQTLRYGVRSSQVRSELWYWTAGDFGGDVRLRSIDKDTTLSSLLTAAAQTARGPLSIVTASPDLTRDFEHVIECLVAHRGNLRVSVMLTSPLDDSEVARCRAFFQQHENLQSQVRSFFVTSRMDTEFAPLKPEKAFRHSTGFLRLLCQGGESLADRLGIFRSPFSDEPVELEENAEDDFTDFQSKGIFAVYGLRSWIPQKEKIVQLAESLLSRLVADEEKRAAFGARIRSADPSSVVGRALYLGQSDEPLSCEDFDEQIPDLPPSPLESWKVPVSRERARKERRHIQRVVQRDFTNYTEALKGSLDQVTEEVCERSAASFSEATKTYREDLLQGLDLGGLSLLVRNYYPAFDNTGESPMAGQEVESKGWLPHESMDCFCQVYDALEEGLDRLPTKRIWLGSGAIGMIFLVAAFMNRASEITWLPMALMAAGFMTPVCLWAYRRITLWRLRRQLVNVSYKTFLDLREAFDAEVQWIIQQTGVQLERDIRKDALAFGSRLQGEFDTMPWLANAGEVDHDGLHEEIRQLRSALLGMGVEENQLDRLPLQLESLATRIIETAQRQRHPDEADTDDEMTPREMVEDWLDELAGTAVLPLEKVPSLQDEILETAGAWRQPPLMAPLTDAELHRGFRKVVILPDTDTVYQHLQEALPSFSGNPVVLVDTWSGSVPGVAVCSVMTGLPDSILDRQLKDKETGVLGDDREPESNNGHRVVRSRNGYRSRKKAAHRSRAGDQFRS